MTGLRNAFNTVLVLPLLLAAGELMTMTGDGTGSYAMAQRQPIQGNNLPNPFNQNLAGDQIPTNTSYGVLLVHPTAGVDRPDRGSQQHPLRTITYALQIATPNTIIVLSPGLYTAASGEQFPLRLRPGVTVQGISTQANAQAVIQGGGDFVSPTLSRQNVTIIAADRSGLAHVVVANPNAQGRGVWIEAGSPVLLENTFTGSAHTGVFIAGRGQPTIVRNRFYQNAVAGLVIYGTSTATVEANVFEQTGIGITVSATATPRIIHNQIVRNQEGIVLLSGANPILQANDIRQNRRNGVVDFGHTEAIAAVIQPATPSNSSPVTEPTSEPTHAPRAETVNHPPTATAWSETEITPVGTAENSTAIIAAALPASVTGAVMQPEPPPVPAQLQPQSEPPDSSSSPTPAQPLTPPASTPVTVVSPSSASVEANPVEANPVEANPVEANPNPVEANPSMMPALAPGSPTPPRPELPTLAPISPDSSESPPIEAITATPPASPAIAVPIPSTPDQANAAPNQANVAPGQANVAIEAAPLSAAETLRPEPIDLATLPTGDATGVAPPASVVSVPPVAAQPTPNDPTIPQPEAIEPEAIEPEAIEIAVIPPPTTPAPSLAEPSPADALPDALPDTPETANSLPQPPAPPIGDRLAVPNSQAPIGSAGGMANVVVPATLASAAGVPPPPPSRAETLGLYYLVLVEAPNGTTQDQVRAIVADAFRTRVNGQVMMQAGAYPDEPTAIAMAEMLRRHGLEARVEDLRQR